MIGNRIKQLREEKGINQEELAKKISVSPSAIGMYETNKREPNNSLTLKLATFFEVSTDYLLGKSDVRLPDRIEFLKNNPNLYKIPLLGIVKAGYNYLAEENIIDYITVTDSSLNNKDFFALKVKGDSMIPEIYEGDIAIVKKQNDFENGDYVVALINEDEATIKKGYKTDNGLLLQPINQSVAPLIFDKETIKSMPVTIIGVVYNISRSFK